MHADDDVDSLSEMTSNQSYSQLTGPQLAFCATSHMCSDVLVVYYHMTKKRQKITYTHPMMLVILIMLKKNEIPYISQPNREFL